jgi:hypothetical protein
LIEFCENSAYAIFNNYLLFPDEDHVEPRANSIIGDPANGMIGILLAVFYVRLFEVPGILPRPWTWLHCKDKKLYVLLNLLGMVFYGVSSIVMRWQYPDQLGQCFFPNGEMIYLICGSASIVFLYIINRKKQFYQFLVQRKVARIEPPTGLQPEALCVVETLYRYDDETRYHLLFGGWLICHIILGLLFICPWLSGFYMGLIGVGILLVLFNIGWFVLDAVYRQRDKEPFSLRRYWQGLKSRDKKIHCSVCNREVLAGNAPKYVMPSETPTAAA